MIIIVFFYNVLLQAKVTVTAPAVGQPWTRLEQPRSYPGFGDINMEPAHHHSKHKAVIPRHAHVLVFSLSSVKNQLMAIFLLAHY